MYSSSSEPTSQSLRSSVASVLLDNLTSASCSGLTFQDVTKKGLKFGDEGEPTFPRR